MKTVIPPSIYAAKMHSNTNALLYYLLTSGFGSRDIA